MPIDDSELKRGLMEDAAKVETESKKTQRALGAPGMVAEEEIAPKAIMSGRMALHQEALTSLDRTQQDTIKQLLSEASMLNEADRAKFGRAMTTRLNQFKIMMIKRAQELEKKMARRNLSQAQRQAIASAVGGLAGGVVSGAVAGLGQSTPEVGVENTPAGRGGYTPSGNF